MPAITVPILDQPTTALRPLSGTTINARMSPDTAGAGLGQGIEHLAGSANAIFQDMAQRANAARVLAADTQDAGADLQARTELSQVKGLDAAKAFQDMAARRQQEQNKILAGLGNPDQRDAFRARAAARAQSFAAFGNQHIVQQSQAYDQQNMTARGDMAVQTMQSRASDLAGAQDELDAVTAELSAFGQRQGMPPAAVDLARRSIVDRAAIGMMSSLIQGQNDIGASQAFAHFKDQMTPEAQTKAAGMLEKATVDGTAQRIVDQYVIRGNLGTDGLQRLLLGQPPSEARDVQDEIARLKAIPNPEPADVSRLQSLQAYAAQQDQGPQQAPTWVRTALSDTRIRDAVEQRATDAINLRTRAQQEGQRNAMTDAWQTMNTAPRGIDAVPPDAVIAMGPERWSALQSAERRRVAGAPADPRVSAGLRYRYQQLAVSNPAAFAQVDLTAPDAQGLPPLTTMSPEDFKFVADMQQEARKTGAAGQLMQSAAEKERIIGEALAPLGLDKGAAGDPKASDGDRTQVLQFRQQFDAYLANEQTRTGKPVPPEIAQKAAMQLAAQIVTDKGRLWNTRKPLFQIFGQVPQTDRDLIAAAYRTRFGRDPLPDEVLAIWQTNHAPAPTPTGPTDTAPPDAIQTRNATFYQ